MYRSTRQKMLVLCCLLGQFSYATGPVAAASMCDWLWGPSAPTQPATVTYYPSNAAYQAAKTNCYSPVTSYAAPNANCCPSTVVYQSPAAVCCPPTPVVCPPEPQRRSCCLSSWFQRRTSYRPTWNRVRVTRYRPVTSCDPITGGPVTVMKPCSTYDWQQQTQRSCGLWNTFFGGKNQAPAATPCTLNPCQVIDPCQNPCQMINPCPSECMVTSGPCESGPSSAPYYAPTPAGMPSAPQPTLAPGVPSNPTLNPPPSGSFPVMPPQGPSTVLPPQGSGTVLPPSSPAPANVQPSLVPGEPGSGIAPPQPQASVSPAWKSGPPLMPPGSSRSAMPPVVPPQQNSAATVSKPVPVPWPTLQPPAVESSTPYPAPIPDVNAQPQAVEQSADAPQLAHPEDRVAQLRSRQAWAFTTISWPRDATDVATQAATFTRQASTELDDSGWHSIAP